MCIRDRVSASTDDTAPGGARQATASDSSRQKKDRISPIALRSPSLAGLKEAEPVKSCMVALGKTEEQKVSTPPSVTKAPEEWVKAKEFVPGQFYVGSGNTAGGLYTRMG